MSNQHRYPLNLVFRPGHFLARPAVTAALLLVTAAGIFAQAGQTLVDAAREQIGVTVLYDPAYYSLAYPGGDLPADRGVCTDVLVRAYRKLGIDLQERVHRDMRAAWPAYPKRWGLARPDPSIDHRRVPNLTVFFARHGRRLAVSRQPSDYAAGDIVTWRLPSGVPHIGLVSDRRRDPGVPLVIHNIGLGVREEDILFAYPVTGHYRYPPEPPPVQPPGI